MIVYRSTSVFRLSSTPKLFSRFKHSHSVLSNYSQSPLSCSASPLRIRLFWLRQSSGGRVRTFGTSAAAVADNKGTDTFFVDEGVSWSSLGLSDQLSRALTNAGVERPSLVQAACIPTILSNKDVVVAAETGSGKTLGYLAPLINKLCGECDGSRNTNSDETLTLPHRLSLVLCPNVLLCEQVVQMANGLRGDNGEPLLRVAAVCGRQGWPVNEPDIIVSTPAALLNNIDPKKRCRFDFIRSVKYVVFDEADLLLCGSFQNQVIRLINMLRFDEKLLSRSSESIPEKPVELDSDSQLHFDSRDDEDLQNLYISGGEEEISEGIVNFEDLTKEAKAESMKKKGWRRVREIYQRSKQYIFIAATLPVNGKKTSGAVIRHLFPHATWINGNYLHCHNPRLKQRWIEVTVDTQVDALIEAVNQGCRSEEYSALGSRTMVFANTVEAVEAVANIFQRAGIECYRYHKELSLEDRAKTLVDFRENGGIFVCTDAAARGVDIPNVLHVIQADFATSAVDFLHRVGRTARAGQYGLVTSLYTESNSDLVNAIHQAAKLGQPVETSFSRKRSFRKKLKKRGSSEVRETSSPTLTRV